MSYRKAYLEIAMTALAAVLVLAANSAGADMMKCPLGGYSSPDGGVASLTAMRDGRIRYTFFDGVRGVLGEEGAALACVNGVLTGVGGALWQPVEMRVTRTTFESDNATLLGELIEPVGVNDPPLVVLT